MVPPCAVPHNGPGEAGIPGILTSEVAARVTGSRSLTVAVLKRQQIRERDYETTGITT
jgi:hypothetical protein